MTPVRSSIRAASLAALLAAALAHAESATTKDKTRLRHGPSAVTEQLGEIDVGASVELLGESGTWRQVRTSDGRVGWLAAEHLVSRTTEAKSTPPPPAPARAIADEIHDLRAEVSALRQRPEPATAADLERIRQELERVAAAQRDVARRLDDRVLPASVDPPPPDGVGTLAPALLLVGAVFGFAGSRLLQGRRERRQRNRLRL